MLQDVPECSRMFNVPDFIEGPTIQECFKCSFNHAKAHKTKTKQSHESNPSNASIDVAICSAMLYSFV